jgi:dihydroorotase-like cyclic amidohydrolase
VWPARIFFADVNDANGKRQNQVIVMTKTKHNQEAKSKKTKEGNSPYSAMETKIKKQTVNIKSNPIRKP